MVRIFAIANSVYRKGIPIIAIFRRYPIRYSLVLSSSSDEDSDAQSDDSSSSSEQDSQHSQTNKTPARRALMRGNRHGWPWDVKSKDQLVFSNLPHDEKTIASLKSISAAYYTGHVALLPKPIAEKVNAIRHIKQLIFGSPLAYTSTPLLSQQDDYALYLALSRRLATLHAHRPIAWQSKRNAYRYHLSYHGVLCGKMPGPRVINCTFMRWIHLNFGLFKTLRLQGSKAIWYVCGAKLYRFLPLPYVTVLRIILCNEKNGQRRFIHVTRAPESPYLLVDGKGTS